MTAIETMSRPHAAFPTETQDRFARLDRALASAWDALLGTSPFVARIRARRFDARLYGLYLTETYHYIQKIRAGSSSPENWSDYDI